MTPKTRLRARCLAPVLAAGLCHPAAASEVIVNGSFEGDAAGWSPLGAVVPSIETVTPVDGCCHVRISNRNAFWNGIGQELLGRLIPGRSYRVSLWGRIDGSPRDELKVTLRRTDAEGNRYSTLAYGTARDDRWTLFEGAFTHEDDRSLSSLFFYVEGPQAGVDLIIDAVSLTEIDSDWRAEADERIEQVRRRNVALSVVDSRDCPIGGAEISIEQVESHFGFGTAISHHPMGDPRYTDFIAENFEWAVMENAAKWRQNQPQPDVLRYENADLIAEFCRLNGIRQRGHCVVWANEERTPDWVVSLDDEALEAAVRARFEDVIARYADDFEHWDVNNEMISNSFFADRLGPDIRPWMFQLARELDPDCTLMVNDFSVISDNRQTAIRQQVEDIEAGGGEVDAIGVQGHFDTPPAPEVVLARLDHVARAGKPIWITEFHVTAPDPEVRAAALEDVYRVAFSHPAVEGILMWGFWAGAHFVGSDAALVDLDWTVNAAGERYLELREAWSTNLTASTGPDGRLETRVFLGKHRVRVRTPAGTEVFEIEIGPGEGGEEIVLRTDDWCTPPDCPGDLDGDLEVDGGDLGLLLAAWGACRADSCIGDLDASGGVDGGDLGLLLSGWGLCP